MSDGSAQDAARSPAGIPEAIRRQEEAYPHGEHRPLRSFTAIMAAYGATVSVAGVAAARAGLPERLPASDLALVAVATHKLSRVLAKDPVTSPLRAPFATFSSTSGEAELQEEVRGTGMRKAVGS